MAITDRVALAIESLQVGFNSTSPVEENFEGSVQGVYLSTNKNCYIAFDTSANTDDFLLAPSDGVVEIEPCQFTRLSVLGETESGTLYVIATRA